jgi:predicted NBD/HSP70 family sugar kinase
MTPNATRLQDAEVAPGSVGDVLRLIREERAVSRSAIARRTGLSPSTVGIRVDALLRLGLVAEGGDEESRGGRRARRLDVVREAGSVAAVDFGARHLTVAVADLAGDVVGSVRRTGLPDQDPEAVVAAMWSEVQGLLAEHGLDPALLSGIGVGLPAPIEHPSGRVVLPSFMPSWHNVSLPSLFAAHTDVPVVVENDANLVALAESAPGARSDADHLLAVVLGTRIGSGILTGGRLHRGASGAAGEISHSAVDGEAAISCICGIPNCLESVAGGGAVAARLTALGHPVESASDIIELGRTADPEIVTVLREAGTRIGASLATIVNFLNPRAVVLSGTMSASAPLVAAIRAELFSRCLPIAAHVEVVRAAVDPANAVVRGATRMILEEVLAPARVEQRVRALAEADAPGATA